MNIEKTEEEFDLRNVKWRMLSLLDAKEFKKAAQESTESNYEFLAYGAMFEAIHGSAPRIAGKNVANPTGLMLASVLMLEHIGQQETGVRIHNAWLRIRNRRHRNITSSPESAETDDN